MLYYVILAAAVVIIVGIAIAGLTFTRRRRARTDLEGMTFADPADAEPWEPQTPEPDEGPAAETAAAGSPALKGLAAEGPAADKGPAEAALPAGNGSPEVEALLAEWRAENHVAATNGAGGQADPTSGDRARPEVTPGIAEAAPAAGAATADGYAARAAAPAAAPAPAQIVVVIDAEQPAFAAAPGSSGSAAAPASDASAAALLADPLGAVILALADGRGKLNGQDLKRLDVFRPERIELAVQTVELPSRLVRDEDALLRLAQIQLYAATLELRAKWSAQMPRPAGGAVPEPPYSARDFKLKMARDVMTLPAADRSEVIGYLLGGLLSSEGAGSGLKRAVIDTLEHLHSAALVNVLLDCLDDPDPIIQDYALAAADRLLEE